jgi:hypothetical protein
MHPIGEQTASACRTGTSSERSLMQPYVDCVLLLHEMSCKLWFQASTSNVLEGVESGDF